MNYSLLDLPPVSFFGKILFIKIINYAGCLVNGLAAISACNGWAMAFTGATIVLSGLAILSFIISLLPKILSLLKKRASLLPDNAQKNQETKSEKTDFLNADLQTLKQSYAPLVRKLGASFQLSDLFELTKKNALPHPHLSIKRLREEGTLISKGAGLFTWKP